MALTNWPERSIPGTSNVPPKVRNGADEDDEPGPADRREDVAGMNGAGTVTHQSRPPATRARFRRSATLRCRDPSNPIRRGTDKHPERDRSDEHAHDVQRVLSIFA